MIGKSKKLAILLASLGGGFSGCQSVTVGLPSVAPIGSAPVPADKTPQTSNGKIPSLDKIPTDIPTPLIIRMTAAKFWIGQEKGRNWRGYLRKHPLNDEEMALAVPVAVNYLQKLGRDAQESRYVALYFALKCHELRYAWLSAPAQEAYNQELESFRNDATEESLLRAYDTIYTFIFPFIRGPWPSQFKQLAHPDQTPDNASAELSSP